jgi:ribonuclease Z
VSFEVTILGSGAAVPTHRRNPTSQYLICNDRHILIDCGEGTQLQLRKYGVKIQRINHVLISHLHGDHFFGLVGLISTMHLLGRSKGLVIYGPSPLEGIVRSQLEIGGAKLDFQLTFVSIDGDVSTCIFEDRCIEIHAFPLKHRVPTNGFVIREKQKEFRLKSDAIKGSGIKLEHIPKLKKGQDVRLESGELIHHKHYTLPPKPSYSYAYCSDTAYWETIVPHITGATVLYHEATFIQKELERARSTFHSTAAQAARIALSANVEQLLLGHISARYEHTETHLIEAQEIFKNSTVVEDGDTYVIGA